MTTTVTSPAQHLRRIADAITALADYLPEHINTAPTALRDELANAITSTPPAVLAELDAQHPEAGITALLDWAVDYTERRDYPRFFELLEKLRAIGEDEAVDNPEHGRLSSNCTGPHRRATGKRQTPSWPTPCRPPLTSTTRGRPSTASSRWRSTSTRRPRKSPPTSTA